MRKTFGRYSPTRRFEEVRALLNSSGERVYDEYEGNRKVWRLMPSAREGLLTLTTSQMVSLFLSRRVFDFLEGTGFKEDLDEIFHQLEAHLKRKDFVAVRNLDRKLFDVNEAPFFYEGRIEDVNDIITALIREEQISATHASVGRGAKTFVIDPYTLLVYKKGLYLAGYSHLHDNVRTFGLDGFRSVDWKKGEKFEYPADYQPAKLVEGAFGLFTGPPAQVRIFFDEKVARYVKRRQWHPTQVIDKVPGGIVLTLQVHGTVEVLSWVLGFGEKAEILEPESMRAEAARIVETASKRYKEPMREELKVPPAPVS
jgi:proteasome accessory factor B